MAVQRNVAGVASLLPEILCDISQQASSPCKDYYQLIVSKTEVILRVWELSNPNRNETAHPTTHKKSHRDFLQDRLLQDNIKIMFGQPVVDYVLNLCQQNFDYLVRLPDDLTRRILSFLDWEDIKNISQTCEKLQQICSSEDFWAQASNSPYGQDRVPLEGVSPAIQRRLLAFHRREALLHTVQQQKRRRNTWQF